MAFNDRHGLIASEKNTTIQMGIVCSISMSMCISYPRLLCALSRGRRSRNMLKVPCPNVFTHRFGMKLQAQSVGSQSV